MSYVKFTPHSRLSAKGILNMYYTDETLDDYLNRLSKDIDQYKEDMGKIFAKAVVGEYGDYKGGYIAPLMSHTFNPELYMSGQDVRNWEITTPYDYVSIEVLYTGMGLHEHHPSTHPKGGAKVWWEFATRETWGKPLTERRLDRDYAWYQETGKDKLAKPVGAKHKHAIFEGLKSVDESALKGVEEYLEDLINR